MVEGEGGGGGREGRKGQKERVWPTAPTDSHPTTYLEQELERNCRHVSHAAPDLLGGKRVRLAHLLLHLKIRCLSFMTSYWVGIPFDNVQSLVVESLVTSKQHTDHTKNKPASVCMNIY